MNTTTTQPPEVSRALSPIDRSAIATYLIHMEQLEKANDWRNLSQLVTEDCITMPPRHTTKEGRQNWLRWIEEMDFRVQDAGRFMAVLRKRANDEWLATHWIWNSETRRV